MKKLTGISVTFDRPPISEQLDAQSEADRQREFLLRGRGWKVVGTFTITSFDRPFGSKLVDIDDAKAVPVLDVTFTDKKRDAE
jgi:hypothetical protein